MSSIPQILANRANAQLSTGPQSEAGLSACKYNASKHSLTGKQIVVAGEDPAEYDSFRTQLLVEYAPAGEREAMLVEQVAQHWWRHERALRTEAKVIAKYGDLECITDPEARKAFSLISRYTITIERSLHRASQELDKLQKARKKAEADKAMAAFMSSARLNRQARPMPVPPKIGSVSQPAKTRHPNEDLPLACRL